MIVKQR